MKIGAAVIVLYGCLVLAGGILGYLQVRSLASLVTGVGTGLLFFISGLFIWQGSVPWGYAGAALVLLLSLYFGYRFAATGKLVPGGIMLMSSFIVLFFLLLGLFLQIED